MNPGLQSKGCPCVVKVVQTNHGKAVPSRIRCASPPSVVRSQISGCRPFR
jgi:hypothetical protein